jgi:hypothetical protein
LVPLYANADAGTPMLPFANPVILISLIPVIAIEAAYLRAKLKTGWRVTLGATAKANVVTLLLGYPIMWALFLGMEFLFWFGIDVTGVDNHLHWAVGRLSEMAVVAASAAWIGPVQDRWAIPFAYVILLIPSFIVSGFVESRLIERGGWLRTDSRCTRAVWMANLLSYVFLAVVGCIVLWRFLAHYEFEQIDDNRRAASSFAARRTTKHLGMTQIFRSHPSQRTQRMGHPHLCTGQP